MAASTYDKRQRGKRGRGGNRNNKDKHPPHARAQIRQWREEDQSSRGRYYGGHGNGQCTGFNVRHGYGRGPGGSSLRFMGHNGGHGRGPAPQFTGYTGCYDRSHGPGGNASRFIGYNGDDGRGPGGADPQFTAHSGDHSMAHNGGHERGPGRAGPQFTGRPQQRQYVSSHHHRQRRTQQRQQQPQPQPQRPKQPQHQPQLQLQPDADANDIPHEVLVENIFSYLDIRDLGCVGRTCARWNKCLPSLCSNTLSNTLWRDLAKGRWPELTSLVIDSSELGHSYNFRALCKEHLRSLADADLFGPWERVLTELLVGKPIGIEKIGWLVRNGNIEGSIEALSAITTAPYEGLIPPLFRKYETPILDQYDIGGDAVQFPEIPSNLSNKARRAHLETLRVVKCIYLDDGGNLKVPRPAFRYTSDAALHHASSGFSSFSPYEILQKITIARNHGADTA